MYEATLALYASLATRQAPAVGAKSGKRASLMPSAVRHQPSGQERRTTGLPSNADS
jgi:hypothetical protein